MSDDLPKQALDEWARELDAREKALDVRGYGHQVTNEIELVQRRNELRRLQRQDELEQRQHEVAIRQPAGDGMESRRTAALLAITIALVLTLGTFGMGLSLVLTGQARNNTTFAALGVAMIVVAALIAGAGAWKISGPGFELSQQPARELTQPDQKTSPKEKADPNAKGTQKGNTHGKPPPGAEGEESKGP